MPMAGAAQKSPDGLVTVHVQSLFYENPADLQHKTSRPLIQMIFPELLILSSIKKPRRRRSLTPLHPGIYSRLSFSPHCCRRWYWPFHGGPDCIIIT